MIINQVMLNVLSPPPATKYQSGSHQLHYYIYLLVLEFQNTYLHIESIDMDMSFFVLIAVLIPLYLGLQQAPHFFF